MSENNLLSTLNGSNNNCPYIKKGVKYLVETSPEMTSLPPEYVLPQLQEDPLSASTAEVPVIDLSGLDGPPHLRLSTVKAISSACELWGFFRIINHGIRESLLEEMLGVAQEFFDLSLDEKMKYASDDVLCPVRYGTSLNTSKKHNLHWRDYFRHYGHPFENSFHLWPLNPPHYRNVAREYMEEIWKVAMKLAGAISEGLGLDVGYIEKSMGQGIQILANNYYPPCPEPNKTLGLAAHSDHGGITILMQNGVNGLQIRNNNEWRAVDHVPGTLLVNIGDYLEILSNGKYKSVEHRGTVNADKTRISVAVGHGPDLLSTVQPASPLVEKKERASFRPITYKDYIKFQQTTPVRGKSALQAILISK
ncbi:2-oxoglutarate (2OG) and Fe(II)-dependent oxygenase superfamily protein [Striga hermonthica]|uniref:2-oxoglutarate (2OG) and Fe(II)-dependent oxygenase superfamily protein n=1 Tax=Striga hermonthica TaxID=68872 RepID=A0A9N7MU13_STRHE|nr:2-oxoglutarate (2OG) and Fe(II)-dependent oxygenase superfamily protein [Striga hermonthica]